ncbi:tRNA (guanine(10)-N(2))-dimethyltransferase [Candidatus Geothermarchaeota archaeon ex4572_27]|nr:MAG: tRNA (guanine(10)-N(2))-dimethyltransferase [Candidatus Geothermarchaeota archaeon ex4572_27]
MALAGEVVTEGAARIYTRIDGKSAFYNPLARLSRSIAVAIVAVGRLVVADALAGTGVRGIRYLLETNAVDHVLFNDKSSAACEVIKANLEANNLADKGEVVNLEANHFMHAYRFRFNVVDIDPFGSPAPFVDSAVATVRRGGVVAVTATDLAPLCGLHPQSVMRKYSSMSIYTDYCKEVGLRILIKEVVSAAGRHMRYATILTAHVTEQYARVYMLVEEGKRPYPHGSIGFLVHSFGDNSVTCVPAREFYEEPRLEAGDRVALAGPLWIGPLHDKKLIEDAISIVERGEALSEGERRRVLRILRIFRDEAEMPPYHYNIHRACKEAGVPVPKVEEVIEGLRQMGYAASRTHFCGYCIKTNAPYRDLLYLLRGM